MDNKFVNNLKRQAEENPVLAVVVGAGLVTATSKLVSAVSDSRNSRVWAKEVARRTMKDKKK